MGMHHVIIIGGGFGGLYAATALKKAPVEVTLIDRRNFHLFQPLLYQVATGGLSPANIAAPLRSVLRNQKNTKVILGEVIDIDAANKKITLTDKALPYDTLIVATGSHHHYFGHPEWMGKAPGLKTIEDALEMRKRILLAYEQAEKETDESKRKAHLTFVVIGGGPTGVELAGALADIARQILKKDFRAIHVKEIRIILVEGLDRVLLTYPKELSEKTRQTLVSMGVEVHTGCFVTDIQDEYITVSSKKSTQTIPTRTVLWAAGVQASSLGKTLAQKTGISTDKQGRIFVEPDLSLKNHPEIFVIGDLAHARDETGNPLPGVAPVAMQQGKYVAELIKQGVQARHRFIIMTKAAWRPSERPKPWSISRVYISAAFLHG